MKSTDIRTGTLYAYSRRQGGDDHPAAVVVVDADSMYVQDTGFGSKSRRTFRKTEDTKAKHSYSSRFSTGYVVIAEGYGGDPAVKLAALREIAKMDPADLQALLLRNDGTDPNTGLPGGLIFVVVNQRTLHGEYDTVKAEIAERQAAEKARRVELTVNDNARTERAQELTAAFAAHGIAAKGKNWGQGGGVNVTLSEDEARKLLALLER